MWHIPTARRGWCCSSAQTARGKGGFRQAVRVFAHPEAYDVGMLRAGVGGGWSGSTEELFRQMPLS